MTKNLLSETQQAWLNRTLFQCKRGNLETELLLVAYAPTLLLASDQQQGLFQELLNESDKHLFYWLLPDSQPQTEACSGVPVEYQTLIADIRNNYLNSTR
ncbi:MAG: succinate dehydrogenase assembly factor 2 [Pseudomonadota bacterium]|nr:succinate dehydrogenase assembly factor 2 [Pseudomonadota bacterium]